VNERVLVVEDEADLRSVIEYNLAAAGYRPVGAGSGLEALRVIAAKVPDLVILDLMLPDLPGTEVCRELRRKPETSEVPVLMLTAKAEDASRIYGFEVGADDYVVKPVSMRELMLRIEAILRRRPPAAAMTSPAASDGARAAGGVVVDAEAPRVEVDGQEVELTPLELRLLVLLMDRAGRVQTRETLLREVWGKEEGLLPRTVDMRVKRLRCRLGRAGENIETVRGVGYRFSAREPR